jgi:hypothetical protein
MKAHKAASNQLANLREVTLLPNREVSLAFIVIYEWHLSPHLSPVAAPCHLSPHLSRVETWLLHEGT